MTTYLVVILVLGLLAFGYLKLANRFNIIDKPNERSSHTTPTIRGGGILFFLSMLLFFVASDFQYPYFIIGLSLIAIVSFIDDLVTLGAKLRLVFQFIALGLLLYEVGFVTSPYLTTLGLLVLAIGFTNIYNFMDGINGITGLCSLATLLGFFLLNKNHMLVPYDFIIYPILAILVFGFFNFRKKARFFAGDVGSISIALVIAFLLLKFIQGTASPLPLLLVIVYGIDGGFTVLRRLLNKENILKPHRSHLYQRLVQKTTLTHLQVSGIFSTVQLLMIVPVVAFQNHALLAQLAVFLSCLVFLGIVYQIIYRKIDQRVTTS